MFYDLNIPYPGDTGKQAEYITMAQLLGYKGIAFNTIINLSKYTKLEKEPSFPKPPELHQVPKFKVWNRCTLNITNFNQLRCLKSISGWDLVAVTTNSEDLINKLCQNFYTHFDIISLELTRKLPFLIKHKMITAPISQGILLEVSYVSAIKDSASCRNIVSNTINLAWASRNRGILLTSNAERPLFLRGPYDVFNLAGLFNIPFKSAKIGMSRSCEEVVNRGQTRDRTYAGLISSHKLSDVESWRRPEVLELEESGKRRCV